MLYVYARFVTGKKHSKPYAFKTTMPNLRLNNWILVHTVFGPQVARFIEYVEKDELPFEPNKWVIERISYKEKIKSLERMIEL